MPEIRKKPILFEKYPNLEGNVPWIKLVPSQTPVRELTKIEENFGDKNIFKLSYLKYLLTKKAFLNIY